MSPKVSVNVVVRNGMKYLPTCFEHLARQDYAAFEIFAVDNGSNDGSREFLRGLESSWNKCPLKTHFSSVNLGFAIGHNFGFFTASGDYVLCLNVDVALEPDFISRLVGAMKKNEKIGATQGKVRRLMARNEGGFDKTLLIDTTGLKIFKNRRVVNRGQGETDEGQYDNKREIWGADGSTPLYRRAALENVKLPLLHRRNRENLNFPLKGENYEYEFFDEDFFLYKEDVDLAWRLNLAGWKTIYVPEAIAYHDRTAGESASNKYWDILKGRKKIGEIPKYHSFRNQRLMQVKNEYLSVFLRHLPWILPKEIAAWIYALIFERYVWKAMMEIFWMLPLALKKRRLIMKRAKIGASDILRWFDF